MLIREEIYSYISLLQGESTHLLKSEVFSKEMAYETLTEWTDEDFGYDTEAWEKYFSQFDLDNVDETLTALKGRVRKIKEQEEKN